MKYNNKIEPYEGQKFWNTHEKVITHDALNETVVKDKLAMTRDYKLYIHDKYKQLDYNDIITLEHKLKYQAKLGEVEHVELDRYEYMVKKYELEYSEPQTQRHQLVKVLRQLA